MKLDDAPGDVRAALDVARTIAYGRPPVHPAHGELWFAAVGCCDVCGWFVSLVQDHCHVTGLYRGRLCHGCNVAEGRNRGDHWPYWRLHAPGLANRELVEGERSPYLTDAEVMSLPLEELFAVDDDRANRDFWAVAPSLVEGLYTEATP